MKRAKQNKGFTLAEITIVVSIISVVLTVVMPSFEKARESTRREICRVNRRNIYGAATVARTDGVPFPFSINYGPNAEETVGWITGWGGVAVMLVPDYLRPAPECGSGGTYGIHLEKPLGYISNEEATLTILCDIHYNP